MKKFLLPVCYLMMSCAALRAQETVITRDGWNYDRQGFVALASEVEEVKKAGKGIKLNGWLEYDVEIPKSGWYELWLGGTPPEWPRDVFVDGQTVTRLQFSQGDDKLSPVPKEGIQFKEVNLYLTAGKHVIKLQRLGFPGVLPSVWELREAAPVPDSSIRAWASGSRIVEPGQSVEMVFLGGASEPLEYELFLVNEMTDQELPIGTLAYPSTKEPIEKKLEVPLKEAGLYTLKAKSQGRWLRPSDLKAGYLLAGTKAANEASREKDLSFQVAGIFSNGAVLQQEKPLPVWGWATPGSAVIVQLGEQERKATADSDGKWQVVFDPIKAGGPAFDLVATAADGKKITIKDLLAGEVWLLSGQSNMGGPMTSAPGAKELALAKDFPDVRYVDVYDRTTADGKKRLSNITWVPAIFQGDEKRLSRWRAIHYAFGTDLHKALNIPIGLVAANRGGTFISSWTSRETHEKVPSFRDTLEQSQREAQERLPELIHLGKSAESIKKWRTATAKAQEEGKEPPKPPVLSADFGNNNSPAFNYEALIETLAPFAIRGVLWYQGESDSGMAEAYRERFPAMIANWRSLWKEPDLPFYFVQIAYGKGDACVTPPGDFTGAELKEVQLQTLSVPHTGMAVTDDLMKPGDDVHYPDKLPVGHRLALIALAKTYDRPVAYSGPIYTRQKIEGNKIRLFFDNAEGLQVKGSQLNAFAIAGEDRKWHWAEAVIDGNTVVVSSPEVSAPVAVRYSWAESPRGGVLINKEGLPTPVFRTDDWPMITKGITTQQKN